MKLIDFPLIMAGCAYIAADNGCGYGPKAHVLNPDAEVAEYTPAFVFTEKVLQRLVGKTVQQVMPELLKMEGYDVINDQDLAIELVYGGINDSPELILKKLGLGKLAVWAVQHVFNQFFEGELHQRFTKSKRDATTLANIKPHKRKLV